MNAPKTPFSTCLSGSAKETELRLRSIFQWKKKRPPVVLFVLTALAVLLCFGLVSCESEEPPQEEAPMAETLDPAEVDLPEKTDGQGTNTEDDSEKVIDRNSVEFPLLLSVGQEVCIDLDNDGSADRVLVDVFNDAYDCKYTLSVNGTDYTGSFETLNIYFNNPDPDKFAITDLDTEDGMLEIALPDDGPSNDPHTIFLRYDGGALATLGEVYGMVSEEDLTFDGTGVIASYMRLSVLQTWFAPVQWHIGPDGVFEHIEQELYYPFTYPETPVKTALQELAAYTDKDENSERAPLPVGTKMTFLATDNLRWVQCADENGSEFWLHLDEEWGQEVELYDGSYALGVIEGLSMAD